MFTSSALPVAAFSPWMQNTRRRPRVHESCAQPHQHLHPTQTATAPALHTLASTREMAPEAIQYALPLSAYTADTCGPSAAYTEYNRAVQIAALQGHSDVPLLAPQTQRRLERLRRIRTAGYLTIRPIGINKTMQQLDEEKRLDEEDGRCFQAENLVGGGASAGDTLALLGQNDTLAQDVLHRHSLSVGSALLADLDHDLDAHLVDADASESELQVAGFSSDTPDAYMAEDVEYQYDHSLGHEGLVDAEDHASISSGPSAVTSMLPAVLTATTTASARNCDDSDVDMTLE